MKRFLFFFPFMLSLIALGRTYTTVFPNAEIPISEGGNWINGLTTGLDWSNVVSEANNAHGSETASSPDFTDSLAHLTGLWGSNQVVSGVLAKTGSLANGFPEVEILLRFSLTAHSATGYECTFSVQETGAYLAIVRWNTNHGDYTILTNPAIATLAAGTICQGIITNQTITIYTNGTAVASVTDSTYPLGSPGIGFYRQGGTINSTNYGFSSFTATDGLITTGTVSYRSNPIIRAAIIGGVP